MRVKVTVVLSLILGIGLCVSQRSMGAVFIHEFLADPAPGLDGDANQDGVRDSSGDEFIELFNSSSQDVAIGGWYMTDSANSGTIRHIFADGSLIECESTYVVFGGGQENLFAEHWVAASQGGLSLNNGGDTITLYDDHDQVVDLYTYGSEAGDEQSIVRNPEGSEGEWIKHTELPHADGQLFSPGYLVNGASTSQHNTVPEPATLLSVAFGLGSFLMIRRKV
jgi:hypothetical protein